MGISGQSGKAPIPKGTGRLWNGVGYLVSYPHKSNLDYPSDNLPATYVVRTDAHILEQRLPHHTGHVFFRAEMPALNTTIYGMAYNDLKAHQLVQYCVFMEFNDPEPFLSLTCEKFRQEFASVCLGPFPDPITEREFMIAYMQYLNLV